MAIGWALAALLAAGCHGGDRAAAEADALNNAADMLDTSGDASPADENDARRADVADANAE